QLARQIAEHVLQLRFIHRSMRPQGGHDVCQAVAQHVVGQAGEFSRAAVATSMVGRKGKYFSRISDGVKSGLQTVAEVVFSQFGSRTSSLEENAHRVSTLELIGSVIDCEQSGVGFRLVFVEPNTLCSPTPAIDSTH